MRVKSGTERPSQQRLAATFISLMVLISLTSCAVGTIGAVSVPPSAGSDVARITCRGGTTTIETPIVRARSDGVHLLVRSPIPGVHLSIIDQRGERGWGSIPQDDFPFATTEWLVPGEVRVRCATATGGTDGATFVVVDPERLWHETRFSSCVSGDFERAGFFPFYANVNPLNEGIARAVPGVLDSDVISYAGYPQVPEQPAALEFRILREGDVVGSLEVDSDGDQMIAFAVYSCDDSGIGMPGEPTAGQLATPFELPGVPRCDPYVAECSAIYMTASRFASLTGESPDRYTHPAMPWAACTEDQPEGCPTDPDETVLVLLLSPEDAATYSAAKGCGSSTESPCR